MISYARYVFIICISLFYTNISAQTLANLSSQPDSVFGIPPTIRKIIIRDLNIFDTSEPKYQKFPFPLINRLHIKTKKHIIAREMLCKSGERADYDLIQESARNLRSLHFLSEVTINSNFVARDTIDLEVLVFDQWTTTLGTKYNIQGGNPNYGIRLEEHNLLGYGQTIKFSLARIDNKIQREFFFREDRILGQYLQFYFHFKGLEYGNHT